MVMKLWGRTNCTACGRNDFGFPLFHSITKYRRCKILASVIIYMTNLVRPSFATILVTVSSGPLLLHHITSHHITSHHITSHHITSHHNFAGPRGEFHMGINRNPSHVVGHLHQSLLENTGCWLL